MATWKRLKSKNANQKNIFLVKYVKYLQDVVVDTDLFLNPKYFLVLRPKINLRGPKKIVGPLVKFLALGRGTGAGYLL